MPCCDSTVLAFIPCLCILPQDVSGSVLHSLPPGHFADAHTAACHCMDVSPRRRLVLLPTAIRIRAHFAPSTAFGVGLLTLDLRSASSLAPLPRGSFRPTFMICCHSIYSSLPTTCLSSATWDYWTYPLPRTTVKLPFYGTTAAFDGLFNYPPARAHSANNRHYLPLYRTLY